MTRAVTALACLLAASPVAALTRVIIAGGGGDDTTLASCVAAISSGDVCEFGDSSTYDESVAYTAKSSVTIQAQAGQTPVLDSSSTKVRAIEPGNSSTVKGIEIRNYTSNCIGMPSASRQITVQDVTCHGIGGNAMNYGGTGSLIERVVVYGATGLCYQALTGAIDAVLRNVVGYDCGASAVGITGTSHNNNRVDHGTFYDVCQTSGTNAVYSRGSSSGMVRYTIVQAINGCTTGVNAQTYARNVVNVAGTACSGGCDANTVTSDPLFVDAVGADFHLQATSPAIDLASTSPVTDDIEGTPRGVPDAGAYEWQALPGVVQLDVDGGVVQLDVDGGVVQPDVVAP